MARVLLGPGFEQEEGPVGFQTCRGPEILGPTLSRPTRAATTVVIASQGAECFHLTQGPGRQATLPSSHG